MAAGRHNAIRRQSASGADRLEPQEEATISRGLYVAPAKVGEFVREAFLGLQDDASPKGIAYFWGVVTAYAAQNLLGDEAAELWERRLDDVRGGHCPLAVLEGAGHDDGRAWCAVCGKLPEVENS